MAIESSNAMQEHFDTLVGKLFDGALDRSSRDQFNEFLEAEENRRRFVELSKLHYCLTQAALPTEMVRTARATAAVHDSILMPPSLAAGMHLDVRESPGGQTSRCRRNRLLVAALAGVAAMGLICMGMLSFWNSLRHREVPQVAAAKLSDDMAGPLPVNSAPKINTVSAAGYVARVVSISEDSAWDLNASPSDFLMRLPAGEDLKLIRGVVKLEFASGASAVLRAPVELVIQGPGEVLLTRGMLTGRSEDGDFTVQTPSAYVVDVGTAFGVSVDAEAATNVVVFDGEVHVRRSSASAQKVRLTSGMSIRADASGLNAWHVDHKLPAFDREFKGARPSNLGSHELSLVDVICGSAPGEYRFAGSIDPERGTWSTLPWSEQKGVQGKSGTGQVVPVPWNPWVHGIFIPHGGEKIAVDLEGGHVNGVAMVGGAWGPVWARRRMERQLDPLGAKVDRDVEGFWGAGTRTALLDRSRWVRDGIVGMHANVGITLDLVAIRQGYDVSIDSLRGIVGLLEQSHVSQPFQPQALATFQVYVDGELRYARDNFCREDGDAMFGVELRDDDRMLTLMVTDGNDGPIYDRVILIDSLFETYQLDSQTL